jgi:hypothetical protein
MVTNLSSIAQQPHLVRAWQQPGKQKQKQHPEQGVNGHVLHVLPLPAVKWHVSKLWWPQLPHCTDKPFAAVIPHMSHCNRTQVIEEQSLVISYMQLTS